MPDCPDLCGGRGCQSCTAAPRPRFYVDQLAVHPPARDPQARRTGAKHGHRWCHLITDGTDAELIAFAQLLGLRPAWFQPRSTPHFDLTPPRRAEAIRLGAVEVDRRQFVNIIRAKRGAPTVSTPRTAQEGTT